MSGRVSAVVMGVSSVLLGSGVGLVAGKAISKKRGGTVGAIVGAAIASGLISADADQTRENEVMEGISIGYQRGRASTGVQGLPSHHELRFP